MDLQPAALIKALNDATRLRCIALLETEGELCVCELTHALDESQPKVSRHLAVLRDARIVIDRREGVWIHYRLNPELPAWARQAVEALSRGAAMTPGARAARAALSTMPNRPGPRCPA